MDLPLLYPKRHRNKPQCGLKTDQVSDSEAGPGPGPGPGSAQTSLCTNSESDFVSDCVFDAAITSASEDVNVQNNVEFFSLFYSKIDD